MFRLIVPTSSGGMEFPFEEAANRLERFTWQSRDAGMANAIGMHSFVGCRGLHEFGTQACRERYLDVCLSGEKAMAFALTETGAGSDALAISTRAEKVAGGYRLSGHKYMISLAQVAKLAVVFAQSEDGLLALLVDLEEQTDRVSINPRICNVLRTCPVGDMRFEDAYVPADNLLGLPGEGFKRVANRLLAIDRILVFAFRLGRLRSILDLAVAFGKQRSQFGEAIGGFQSYSFRTADMYSDLLGGRALVQVASRALEAESPEAVALASATRLRIGDSLDRAGTELLQMLGARGTEPGWAWLYLADSRLDRIGGGTSEIQRSLLARFAQRYVEEDAESLEELSAEAQALVELK